MIKNQDADIAGRLRKFRLEIAKCTQAEFAAKLGKAQSLVNMTERGRQGPSRDYLLRISDVFGANVDWILSGKGQPLNIKYELSEMAPPKIAENSIIKSDSDDLLAAGKLLLAQAIPSVDPTGRFGYLVLAGTKLRLHAARDQRLEGTNLYRIIEDDTMWSAVGEPTGLELEIMREYLEHGDDRSLAEWMECFRFLRWAQDCMERVRSEEVIKLERSA